MVFEIVAHRGATAHAPENTLPAFLKAVQLGADAADVAESPRLGDNRVVVSTWQAADPLEKAL